MRLIKKRLGLFIGCGALYYLIECLFHFITVGSFYSHWTMFILAGLLGVFCIDTPNNFYSFELGYGWQVIISTVLCTLAEGICGLIVNTLFEIFNIPSVNAMYMLEAPLPALSFFNFYTISIIGIVLAFIGLNLYERFSLPLEERWLTKYMKRRNK